MGKHKVRPRTCIDFSDMPSSYDAPSFAAVTILKNPNPWRQDGNKKKEASLTRNPSCDSFPMSTERKTGKSLESNHINDSFASVCKNSKRIVTSMKESNALKSNSDLFMHEKPLKNKQTCYGAVCKNSASELKIGSTVKNADSVKLFKNVNSSNDVSALPPNNTVMFDSFLRPNLFNSSEEDRIKFEKKQRNKMARLLKRESKVKAIIEEKKTDSRVKVVSQEVINSYLEQRCNLSDRTSNFKTTEKKRNVPKFENAMLNDNSKSKNKISSKKTVKTSHPMHLNIFELIEQRQKAEKSKFDSKFVKKPIGHHHHTLENIKHRKFANKCKKKSILSKRMKKYKAEEVQQFLDLFANLQLKSSSEVSVLSHSGNSPNDDEKIATTRDVSLSCISIDKDKIEEQTAAICESLRKEIVELADSVHSRKFRQYCTHFVTPEINNYATEFIELLVKFQERQYNLDPIKARTRRRYFCGLRESIKHMSKLSIVILAPDIKRSKGKGGLDDTVDKVKEEALKFGVPVVFALSCKCLGKLCHKPASVSAFAVLNYQGAQDAFNMLMEHVSSAKEQYDTVTTEQSS